MVVKTKMKCVILCGGKGTRLNELTKELPKPLICIGDKPILSHIMDRYTQAGFNEFIICTGYKGSMIEQYFEKNNKNNHQDRDVQVIDTGQNSTKAERLSKIEKYLDEDNFFLAYGDDIANVDIKKLLKFHKAHKGVATITIIHPENPYGVLNLRGNQITHFKEKPLMDEWINGGYMVLNKRIFEYINEGDDLEKEVFKKLVAEGEIYAFKHDGFWKSMNTFKDVQELNELWKNGKM